MFNTKISLSHLALKFVSFIQKHVKIFINGVLYFMKFQRKCYTMEQLCLCLREYTLEQVCLRLCLTSADHTLSLPQDSRKVHRGTVACDAHGCLVQGLFLLLSKLICLIQRFLCHIWL